MMTAAHFEAIDEALRMIAEAGARVEQVSRLLASENAASHFVDALELAEKELTATHISLMRSVTFGPRTGAEQLRLAG